MIGWLLGFVARPLTRAGRLPGWTRGMRVFLVEHTMLELAETRFYGGPQSREPGLPSDRTKDMPKRFGCRSGSPFQRWWLLHLSGLPGCRTFPNYILFALESRIIAPKMTKSFRHPGRKKMQSISSARSEFIRGKAKGHVLSRIREPFMERCECHCSG